MSEPMAQEASETVPAEITFSDGSLLPASVTDVRIGEADADGYHEVEYLDIEGDMVAARDVAGYRVDACLNDGVYSVAVNTPSPGDIRATQAVETVACLKLALANRDATQLKMAAHSAKATITGR